MNTFITPNWVTKEVARYWKNNLVFGSVVDRSYDSQWEKVGAKIGYTVNARLPQRFIPVEGQGLVQQAIFNQTVPITITNQKHIGFGWSSADGTMIVEDVRKRYAMPAAVSLANKFDVDGFQTVFGAVYNSLGAPGVANTTNLFYSQARAMLSKYAVPEPYCAVLDPDSMVQLAAANYPLFNPQNLQSTTYRKGRFAQQALGIDDYYESPNVGFYTTGTFTASTPVVNGANQTGSNLITSGWAAGATTLNANDSFTIAGVFGVNPISYQTTGNLQRFTVTVTTSDTAGAMTIPITPAIITSGPLQTVSNSPANNAAITVVGSTGAVGGTLAATLTRQSLIFNEGAFAAVMADLKGSLAGANVERVRSEESKFSIRWTEQYSIQTDQEPSRFDIIYGWAAVLPYFAVRLYS
jgi:hypothetical protein